MSLQFIRGTSDMDLEKTLLQASVDWLNQDDKNKVFYLVPNHMKFEQEIRLLKQLKKQVRTNSESVATTRLQVFSFYRLAWYYLQNTKYYSSELLTEAGAAMIFRKILVENEESLQVFRGEINKSGFIQQLFELYEEMKGANISIDDLDKIIQVSNSDLKELDFHLKVQDLQMIFTKYEAQMLDYGIKSSEIITYLCAFLEEQNLSHVLFVISGYHHFSARELQLLEVLMNRSGQIKISLILDRKYPNECPPIHDLFYETGTTYHHLYQIARQAKVEILPDYTEQINELINSQEIKKIGDYWIQAQKSVSTKEKQVNPQNHVQIWCAENPKEEISHIAKEIRRLVVDKGYRYKDIQLLTRDLTTYEAIIEPIFAMHDIPLYLDRDMAMEQHPLVAFIHSLFAIHAYHYRYRDILSFLRTELFIPELKEVTETHWVTKRNSWRKKVDRTENVVLAYGYEGYHWTQAKDWEFIRYDFEAGKKDDTKRLEEESNDIRQSIQKRIPPLFEALKKATNGLEAATSFYGFLVEAGVEQQLIMWRNQAIEAGFLEEARNHEQTWTALMTLFDEYVTIYGDTSFELDTFQEIFSSGLAGLRYNKVPTAIDQVQVRAIDLAYPGQAKIIFAMGVTDQVLPKKSENKSLLSDEERELVNEKLAENQFLFNSRQNMAKEPFNAYILFSAATEYLYFTYPSVKDTMKQIKISPYVEAIRQAFSLPVEQKKALSIFDDEKTSAQHISTYRTLIGELTTLKRQKIEADVAILPFWHQLEQRLMTTTQNEFVLRAFGSLTHTNIPEPLSPELAEVLYGKDIYTSVSRMESFYHCQYQYFTRFGLRLKERDRFELSSAATGEFFHEALDQFFKLLLMNNKLLATLTDKEVEQFTEQIVLAVFGEAKYSIVHSSNRMNYIQYQLRQTIKKVSWALKKQSERSGMSTVQTEILFGQLASEKGIRGLELPLKNNGIISVRGKIDRLDQLITPEATYLSVIDYKSSHKKFNITEAYYGLAMQMLTYLDVALMDAVHLIGQPAKPAGSLYLHVQNPTLPFVESDDIEKQIVKKFQYDGLLLNNQDLLDHLDKSLEPKQRSLVFPIEESAKEIIKPGRRQEDKFVSEAELDVLIKHNRNKFVEAGNKIVSGDITLNPAYQGKERIACRYCPFRSVCDFDVMLKENNYHRIEQLPKKEIITHLKGNEQGDEAND